MLFRSNKAISRDDWKKWFNDSHGQFYTDKDLKIKDILTYLAYCLMVEDYHNRPDCQQFLDAMEGWAITADQVTTDLDYQAQINSLTNFNDQFLNNFIYDKLRIKF